MKNPHKALDIKKQSFHQRTYLKKYPWIRNLMFSRQRARRLGLEHTLGINEFKELWFRDKVFEMNCPSIDRINPKLGYVKDNCRFLERSLNCALANLHYGDIKCLECSKEFHQRRATSLFCSKSCRAFKANRINGHFVKV